METCKCTSFIFAGNIYGGPTQSGAPICSHTWLARTPAGRGADEIFPLHSRKPTSQLPLFLPEVIQKKTNFPPQLQALFYIVVKYLSSKSMSVTVGLSDSSLENMKHLCVLTGHIYATVCSPPVRNTGEHKPTALCRNTITTKRD